MALGDGAREPVGGQRALLDEHLLGHLAGAPALFDGARDAITRDEPEVDDDVGQEARRATGVARMRDPVVVSLVRRGRFQGMGSGSIKAGIRVYARPRASGPAEPPDQSIG